MLRTTTRVSTLHSNYPPADRGVDAVISGGARGRLPLPLCNRDDAPMSLYAETPGRDVGSTDQSIGTSDAYRQIRTAIAFLSDHWTDQPDLSALSEAMGCSPAHCQRLFKSWCGVSPKEFVQAITIDHAKRLLQGSASVLDAALEVGLSGPSRLHDLFVDHEAMSPGDYKKRGEGLTIGFGYAESPFGEALIMQTERGICGIAFADEPANTGDPMPGERDRAQTFHDMARRWPRATYVQDQNGAHRAATAIFGRMGHQSEPANREAGSGHSAAAPMRLVLIGTDFEVRVWETLLKIPGGQFVSYSDIARHLGQPNASRAVGRAVGRNPISFVVPCHRVLRQDGGLGGYHWGLTRKKAIIGWEAANFERHDEIGEIRPLGINK